ncbi:MAG: hypothetical protein KGL43_03500 [Burkholderiales bacterium]|nr:hypothetical protein [Burkholderiales bacterium]MDE2395675.1 hypothetical protein [Burkholderiales bacterium]MDE2452637.1 hypothetical protein [Burkholderiales bacterium]
MTPRIRQALNRAAVAALLAGCVGAASARGSVSIGIGFGLPVYGGWGPLVAPSVSLGYGGGWGWHRGWYPGMGVVIAPPPVVAYGNPVYVAPPATVYPAPPAAAAAPPDPVVYPRNGQSPQQTESDHRACDRWATTQPAAMADAGVFQRAVEACMDARGYTLR